MADSRALNMHTIVGTHDVLFITLDTLRFDVAQRCFRDQRLPTLSPYLNADGWELRHSPASFTFAAHQAFFAGFLPTPARPGPHSRMFALEFAGSETIDANTFVFSGQSNIVQGFAAHGYHTICIGGVGFFNLQNPLGCVLPRMFDESHWRPEFGVTARHSADAQVVLACARLQSESLRQRRCFLFINVSALHQPNCHYVLGAVQDDVDTQCAALSYVDGALARLFACVKARGPTLVIVCSDHGTAYGEDGYRGHRLAHEVVMQVPYAAFIL